MSYEQGFAVFFILEVLFWFSILAIVYAYIGYPLLLKALSFYRSRSIIRKPIHPNVSFIIAAYNEEDKIRGKLENTLQLDYPSNNIEIIVASDCSDDRTDEIVKTYSSKGVKLVRAPERMGKEYAQKLAVESAQGEILVFSDVGTILKPDALQKIVSNFADPSVGCVSSVDKILAQNGTVSGENFYVKYEMFLRRLESEVNSLVGLSGSFFAARREVCKDWQTDLQSDFNTLLNSIRMGLRGISDPYAVGYYRNVKSHKKEFERKIRTVVRGISVFMRARAMIDPRKYGLFAFQLLSHKLCRWLVPFWLMTALAANFILASHDELFAAILLVQICFYMMALLGIISSRLSSSLVFKIPSFFVLVNLSVLLAWIQYWRGERLVSWEPSRR
jgi:glycosyltransferase involved in cell wall biosynthesis